MSSDSTPKEPHMGHVLRNEYHTPRIVASIFDGPALTGTP